MRNAFIDELIQLALQHEHIVLMVGDVGYSVVEPFADRFPHRFINAGVAEQSMMSVAAGMASEGYHVFVYSIANFPTFRCAEQIRNDVDYHQLPVTVVAVGGGLSYGNLGYSHHAVQDYGLMRLMPNMLIGAPGDPLEVRAVMRYFVEHACPSYLRLAKAGEPCFHQQIPQVEPGKWLNIVPGKKEHTLLTTGAPLALAMQWLNTEAYADFALHSLPLWGMSAKAVQPDQAAQWETIHTVEDHLPDGGFGSWMREALAAVSPHLSGKVFSKSLDPIVCGMVAQHDVLNRAGGLK